MKRILTLSLLMAATALFAGCSDDDGGCTLRVLTFEDADYAGSTAHYWSSLIDEVQYGGALLYGVQDPNTYLFGSVNYSWYDRGNTELHHALPVNWGVTNYAGGGHAVSNYTAATLSEGDYTTQLAVLAATGAGGHNGSRNFCVHNGYSDGTGNSAENLPALTFGDGVARTIDHMWVCPTNYVLNELTGSTSNESFLKVVATGYDATGTRIAIQPEFYLEQGGKMPTEWTKWSLTAMGKVTKVEFNIEGSYVGDYGLYAPTYFAYDDVAVVFETTH